MIMIEMNVPDIGQILVKRNEDDLRWYVEVYKDEEDLPVTFIHNELSVAWEEALIELSYEMYADLTYTREEQNEV